MFDTAVVRVAKTRLGRSGLRLGTAISGGAALLVFGAAPAAARVEAAPSEIGASRFHFSPPLLRLTPPAAQPARAPSVSMALAMGLPQDLTVHRSAQPAGDLPVANDDVTIQDGDVSTTADGAPGIATTSTGSTTISAGNVSTTGDQSDGITASGSGPISITAADVSTSGNGTVRYGAPAGGDGSYGIRAIGSSDIAINIGSVSTAGSFSTGIFAYSSSGAITINAGSVDTTGNGAFGIYATAHDLTIVTGSIKAATDGIVADAFGAGASINLTINGDISSTDKIAGGIAVTSDGDVTIHDSGSISTYSTQTGLSRVGGGGGIIAQAEGNITIDGGASINTHGAGADGVHAISQNGSIALSLGSVTTYDGEAPAITASTVRFFYNDDTQSYETDIGGDVFITVGDVKTYGRSSPGIVALGANVDITLNGALATANKAAGGVVAVAYAGNVAIHNKESITGGYAAATGIYAKATGDVTIDGGGSITALGANSAGIIAVSTGGGAISVATGDIASGSGAIYAATFSDNQVRGINGIAISTGNVTTVESGQAASGIIAVNQNFYGGVSIKSGSVVTGGDYAYGILVQGQDGRVAVETGDVYTRGLKAGAIIARGGNVDITASDATTSGRGSIGIEGIGTDLPPGAQGHVTITGAEVATAGQNAYGVLGLAGTGDLTVNIGKTTTLGAKALGIYANALNGSTQVTANIVSTAGDDADGVIARSSGYASQKVTVDTTAITTAGARADGILAIAKHAQVAINAGTVSTSGIQSTGIVAYSQYGTATIKAATSTTTGSNAMGLYANGGGGSTITAGTVTTSGDNANAVAIRSGGYGLSGSATVNATTIATHGKQSSGIDALVQGVGETGSSSLTINAGTVTTDGIDSPGIVAMNGYGAINIASTSIATKAAESVGIIALGGQGISVKADTISTVASSLYASGAGSGLISLDLSGKIASTGDTAIVAINQAGATAITIGTKGSVVGAGDGIQVQSGTGQVSITNAGTLAGGAGYAIDLGGIQNIVATGPSDTNETLRKLVPALAAAAITGATITNSGTIAGAVKLGDGNDVVTNSGTFDATKDSDFGAGTDSFTNTGTLSVQPGTKPGSVRFLGLEKFANAGGLIDLRNGVAGDTLTLTGAYAGSGNARLGLDVGANGVADKLVVDGIASGTTSIVLNATAANATLIARPVTLVQAEAGTAATAFTIANQNLGFVAYGLGFDAATNSFALTATAGSAVHRLTRLNEGAQQIWHQSADAWSSHMAELRDTDEPAKRVWGQAYGRTDTSRAHDSGYALGYRQDYFGGQAGIDLGGRRSETGNGLLFGITGGYLSSHLNLRAGPERARYDTLNAGAYASIKAGPLFVNLLGQYDHYRTDANDSIDHWQDKFSGNAFGAQAEAGARLGTDTFFAEPIATISWQRTDLGTLRALGQNLDFGHDTGLTGTLGGRIGATFDLNGGDKALFYAKASYVHEFKGKGGVLFESGGVSEDVAGTRLGDYGKAAIGVTILSTSRISGFIEGDGDVGSNLKGGGGRVGLSFKL